MINETHDVVRERLLLVFPSLRVEYERLAPRYEAIARRIREQRVTEPGSDATG